MKKSIFIFSLFLIQSCISVKQEVENQTKAILVEIRENKLPAFKERMGARFNDDSTGNIYWFNEAHELIELYHKASKEIPYIIEYNSPSPLAEARVMLYKGFDSTTGLKNATMILTFTPKNNYSRKSILSTFSVEEEYDVDYRKYLLRNKLVHSAVDSIIVPMDSTLENERKKIDVFE